MKTIKSSIMKTIKLSFVALAILVLGTFVFTGCSDEGSTVTSVDSQVLKSRIIDEDAFLDEFYEGIPWERRRTVVVRDNRNTYVVSEIILEGDTRARGYLVKDEATGELLHFADVDRTRFVLETIDFVNDERKTFLEIDKNPDYGATDEFNFLEIIENPIYETYGRPMFGGETSYEYVSCGACTCVYKVETIYIFWVKLKSKQLVNITNCPTID